MVNPLEVGIHLNQEYPGEQFNYSFSGYVNFVINIGMWTENLFIWGESTTKSGDILERWGKLQVA